jgi:hypothetical protein
MPDRSDEARARAEATFKKREQRAKESEQVWAEHAAAGKAADENRAKLRAQRLAKEAADERAKSDARPKKVQATLKPDKKSDAREEVKPVKPGQ